MAVELHSGLCMMAFTYVMVSFSPSQAERGGCSVWSGMIHDTLGMLPAERSVKKSGRSLTFDHRALSYRTGVRASNVLCWQVPRSEFTYIPHETPFSERTLGRPPHS